MIQPKESVKSIPTYIPPSGIRSGFIRMDFNENTIGCSPKVVKKIKLLTKEFYSIYPEYNGFFEKVAKYAKVKTGEVLVTNGSDAALKLIFDCYVEKNQEAIILEPSFGMFSYLLGLNGAKIKKVSYGDDLTFPTKKLLNSINKKTRIIVLCNPNNPTGTQITQKQITKILNRAKNSLVLVDEAYSEFSSENSAKLIKKYENLVITRTFSKAFGLAAVRAGYIISNKNTIDYLKRSYGPFEVNAIAKIAVEAAILDKMYVKTYVSKIKRNKKELIAQLNSLRVKTFPSESNFFIARFNDSQKVKQKLFENNILVRDMGKYPLLGNCLRITVGTKKQNNKFLGVLKKCGGFK